MTGTGFLLSILIFFLVIILLNLIITIKLIKRIKLYEDYITIAITGVRTAYTTMKRIDSAGAFEAEDEVGSVFSELADVVYYLRDVVDFIEEPVSDEEEIDDNIEQE